MSRQPVVVIVGRPNVGKSTLFNRLTKSRRALVHDLPGVTRDRIVGDAPWHGGVVTLIDTGGLLFDDSDDFLPLIRSQADQALQDADAVLFLLDGASGLMPEDEEIAAWLRIQGVPVIPVVNKSDRSGVEVEAAEFYKLGMGDPILISAEHGVGLADLWEALGSHIQVADSEEGVEAPLLEKETRIAIIGRPNVGKSSLLNRLVGDNRVLVSNVPGTTRDSVDAVLTQDGFTYRFVDTAGIRRKGKTEKGPEVLSVVMARRQLERAHLCLLLVDAVEGITKQDAHIGGYAWDGGLGLILVVNKWDLVDAQAQTRERFEDMVARQLKFMRHAPVLYLSALTGRGVHKLFPMMRKLHDARGRKVPTSDLNRLLSEAWERRPPPVQGRKEPRFFYATQVQSSPPAFILFTNLNQEPHFSYMRYLENTLRVQLGLEGIPIRVMIRGRKK